MALKATIFKARIQLADMDRNVYRDHELTVARHPSETDERMMVRVLALALFAPANDDGGALEFAKGMWDPEEPELWRRDLTGSILHWIEVGQPEERRLTKASGRAERVSVIAYGQSTPLWWAGIATRIGRTRNVDVWQWPAAETQALAGLTQRGMQLQVSVQDGTIYVSSTTGSAEITPLRLHG